MEALLREIKKNKINSVLISQNHVLIFEYYKNKKQKDKLQHLNSVTKSVMSILIGIAYDKKLIDLDMPIYPFFKDILDQADSRKKEITLYHLLTMTDGLDHPEFGKWNYFSPMNYKSDMVKFVLERPIEYRVGTHMNYSSGDSHLLSAILQQVSHMKTEDFANQYLFKPLGISKYKWFVDQLNINKGADGLRLKAEDMLKIG